MIAERCVNNAIEREKAASLRERSAVCCPLAYEKSHMTFVTWSHFVRYVQCDTATAKATGIVGVGKEPAVK